MCFRIDVMIKKIGCVHSTVACELYMYLQTTQLDFSTSSKNCNVWVTMVTTWCLDIGSHFDSVYFHCLVIMEAFSIILSSIQLEWQIFHILKDKILWFSAIVIVTVFWDFPQRFFFFFLFFFFLNAMSESAKISRVGLPTYHIDR